MSASRVGPGGPAIGRGSRVLPSARALTVASVIAGVVVALALAIYLYDHSQRGVIANGVRIAGVSVGGMDQAAARSKVSQELVARLGQTVTVGSGSRRWT